MAGLLTTNSPVSITNPLAIPKSSTFTVSNPLFTYNSYAGGNTPTPTNSSPAPQTAGQVPSMDTTTPGTVTTQDQIAAQQAAQAAQAAQAGHDLFNTQLGVVDTSAGNAASNSAGDLKTSILQYIDSLKANQTGRNNQQVQNYLGKQQGAQSISDMVGQGIRSGGVTLNHGNAGDSSAAGAIANAYGQLGRGQLSSVGNQFAQAQDQLAQGSAADQTALANKLRDLPQAQSDIVNSIVSDAQQKLGAIDQQMAYMSLPDRVDMEAQKQQITNDVLAKLQGFDQILSSGGNQALTGESPDVAAQRAGQLFSAGQAPANAFQFSDLAPAQLQGTGAAPSELPIYTTPAKKQLA